MNSGGTTFYRVQHEILILNSKPELSYPKEFQLKVRSFFSDWNLDNPELTDDARITVI